MLLARRRAPTFAERLRVALWPRTSWRRSLRYAVLRFWRLDGSPHALALGLAVGVFAAFQPILGFQMLFAGMVAWSLGASIAAALIGTFVGTPVTWPLMWVASYHVGAFITGEERAVTVGELWNAIAGLGASASPGLPVAGDLAGDLVWQLLLPVAVGAVPLGLMAGAAFYVMVLRATALKFR